MKFSTTGTRKRKGGGGGAGSGKQHWRLLTTMQTEPARSGLFHTRSWAQPKDVLLLWSSEQRALVLGPVWLARGTMRRLDRCAHSLSAMGPLFLKDNNEPHLQGPVSPIYLEESHTILTVSGKAPCRLPYRSWTPNFGYLVLSWAPIKA